MKQHLAALAEVVDRSGYYVADREELGRVSRHRHEMENLYERFARRIVDETQLSPLGVFRYFAHYAEQKARLAPDVAFVECTSTQAEGHAREVVQRLGVPCLPLTTGDLEEKRTRIPAQIRTLLVTGFHYGELKGIGDDDLQVVSVPIEVSPELRARLRERPGEVVIVEHDRTEAEHLQRDIEQLDPSLRTRVLVLDDLDAGLTSLLGDQPGAAADGDAGSTLAMLSPRVWGSAAERWRDHPDVGLIRFSVVEDAWPRIADAIGLPLGDVGSRS